MATKYEQALALSKEKNIPVPEAVAQVRNQAPVSATSAGNQMQYEINKQNRQNMANAGTIPAVGTSVTPQGGQTQAPTPVAPVTSSVTPSGATMNADGTVTPATTTPATTTPATTTPAIPSTPTNQVTTGVGNGNQNILENPDIKRAMDDIKNGTISSFANDRIEGSKKTGQIDIISETKAKNEAQMALNKQQAELKEQERQRIKQENDQLSNNAGTIFNTLKAGGSVATTNTPEYKQAQARYNTFKRFSTYDVASLSTAMQGGDLLMGTQAYNDLISDPNMLAKIQKARIFMNGEVDMVAIGEKQGQYVMTQNPTVAKALSDGFMSTEEYNQLTNNPEVEAQAKVVSEAKAKYDEYKRQLEQISDDVDQEWEGKTVTDSFKSAIKANRDKAIRRLYNSASDDLQNASGLYTELKNSSTALLEINMKQYEAEQAKQAQLAAEERAVQRSKDALQYEADFNKKQAQEALNDPATAIKSVMDEYKKLGIPFTSTVQSRLAEFNASGKPLEQFLTEMSQNIQQSPAYKAYAAKKAGEGISYQTIGNKVYKIGADGSITETNISTGADDSKWGVIGKNADGSDKYGFINTATSTVTPYIAPTGEATGDLRYLANQYPGQAWAKNNNPAGITWNSNFDKGTGTAKLFADAGIKFEKGTARPANEGGNYVTFATIEDGLKAQQILMTQTYGNSTVGQMLSSWVGTSEGPNYAKQVAGMAGITDLNQKVSALSPEQVSKLQMAKIQKESPGLAKLLTQPATTPTNSNQYTDQNVNDLAYLVELQEKNPTQAAKEMKELGYSARDIANYKAGNVPLTEKQKTSSINLANSIKDLLTNYDYTDATGFHFFDEAPSGSDWASAEEKIKTIVANLTLPSLGMLKGPMSDKDLAFIQAASSNLSTKQNDEVFGKQLIEAYNLAARRAGIPEVKSLDEIKTSNVQPQMMQTNTNTGGGQTQTYQGYTIKGL